MKSSRFVVWGAVFALVLLCRTPDAAALNTCTASGWWTNDAIWDGNKPAAGHDVYIPANMTVILSEATANLNSFASSGVLIFTNWSSRLMASNVILRAGSMTTCAGPFNDTTDPSNRVWIICTNLLVETNGLIDVSGKGYAGGGKNADGNGPGKGLKVANNYAMAGGGGHGGWGGCASVSGGVFYDFTNQPAIPGSGGGGSAWQTGVGGAGGGTIRIQAALDVTIHGAMRANGDNSIEQVDGQFVGGAGSGGAIYIECSALKGSATGLVSANGGNAVLGGLGAGGRIGLLYNSISQQQAGNPCVNFSANAGTGTSSLWTPPAYGRPGFGTIWMPDDILLSANPLRFQNIGIANPTNWSVNSLSVTGITFGFMGGGFIIVSNDLSVGAGGALAFWEGSSLDVRGDLVLTNGGRLSVYAAITNIAASIGAAVGVTGNVIVATGSRIYLYSDPTNGGSPILRVGSLTVTTNASIDAAGKGFASRYYGSHGYGPGYGKFGNPSTIGAGYGGIGKNSDATYGRVYGSSNTPLHAGSGGGGDFSSFGGRGGGLIRIEALQSVRVDGTLAANSTRQAIGIGSGGSGGGIFILCNEFLGDATGVLTADGGSRGSSGSTAAGGGGRIAVGIGLSDQQRTDLMAGSPVKKMQTISSYKHFDGQATAWGGTNTSGSSGGDGTIVWLFVPPLPGAMMIVQ